MVNHLSHRQSLLKNAQNAMRVKKLQKLQKMRQRKNSQKKRTKNQIPIVEDGEAAKKSSLLQLEKPKGKNLGFGNLNNMKNIKDYIYTKEGGRKKGKGGRSGSKKAGKKPSKELKPLQMAALPKKFQEDQHQPN
jgi:hypothetical protein